VQQRKERSIASGFRRAPYSPSLSSLKLFPVPRQTTWAPPARACPAVTPTAVAPPAKAAAAPAPSASTPTHSAHASRSVPYRRARSSGRAGRANQPVDVEAAPGAAVGVVAVRVAGLGSAEPDAGVGEARVAAEGVAAGEAGVLVGGAEVAVAAGGGVGGGGGGAARPSAWARRWAAARGGCRRSTWGGGDASAGAAAAAAETGGAAGEVPEASTKSMEPVGAVGGVTVAMGEIAEGGVGRAASEGRRMASASARRSPRSIT